MLARGQPAGGGAGIDSRPLEQWMELRVQTATLKKQSLRDAPASLTVITAEDIRRHGFRTLAAALSNVRGFQATSDGPMRFAGARGFSLLGDYNTRFLVLVNAHHMTDNVYGAMYCFGQGFPLGMDLVEQMEIVRGPSSALYGSNGLFATANITTKIASNAPRGAREHGTGELRRAEAGRLLGFHGPREGQGADVRIGAAHRRPHG